METAFSEAAATIRAFQKDYLELDAEMTRLYEKGTRQSIREFEDKSLEYTRLIVDRERYLNACRERFTGREYSALIQITLKGVTDPVTRTEAQAMVRASDIQGKNRQAEELIDQGFSSDSDEILTLWYEEE